MCHSKVVLPLTSSSILHGRQASGCSEFELRLKVQGTEMPEHRNRTHQSLARREDLTSKRLQVTRVAGRSCEHQAVEAEQALRVRRPGAKRALQAASLTGCHLPITHIL